MTSSTSTRTTIALFAPRLRVEERQIIAAFAARGYDAQLLGPSSLTLSLKGRSPGLPSVAIDRCVATTERAVLAALLSANGVVAVNRSATMRLLADRLALLRHLIIAGIPVPETVVAFDDTSTLDALETVGYPALLRSLQTDPRMPDALTVDRDAAESIVEHRAMLGHERAVLVQQVVKGTALRMFVVGDEPAGVALTDPEDDGNQVVVPGDAICDSIRTLGEKTISRLGTGVYTIDVVESDTGPIVVGADNLIDFRSFSEAGIDIAGRIASFALDQLEKSEGSRA